MLTSAGPKVLEFNCRLGDPEAQAVLPSAGIELGETFLSAARGELPRTERAGAQCHSACVILASGGYPGEYETGLDITGLDTLEAGGNVLVFHAGTRKRDGRIVTAGGRVLGVTGTGAALDEALARAYAAIRCIQFKGMHYRRDIGARALRVSH
jgi:phosphoribosylamine--glycine ligase